MQYKPQNPNVLLAITYGSHLYGTSGPNSDFDFKAVYLPSFKQLLLGKDVGVDRFRYTKDGVAVGDNDTMPADGHEAEHFTIHKLVKDYLSGQAYAMEFVYAVLQGAHNTHGGSNKNAIENLCHELHFSLPHKNVQPMVGFAMKQTFDYVRRGERLNAAKNLLGMLKRKFTFHSEALKNMHIRLDLPLTKFETGNTVPVHFTLMDEIAEEANLTIGSTDNQGKIIRTLELNGREYIETTGITHLITAVEKLVDQYGERSTKAGETRYDWKSFSHAVRVYEQVIEHLTSDWITFPRPNARELKEIKAGEWPIEAVKDKLRDLDDRVQSLVSLQQKRNTRFMQERADEILHKYLMQLLVNDKLSN